MWDGRTAGWSGAEGSRGGEAARPLGGTFLGGSVKG